MVEPEPRTWCVVDPENGERGMTTQWARFRAWWARVSPKQRRARSQARLNQLRASEEVQLDKIEDRIQQIKLNTNYYRWKG